MSWSAVPEGSTRWYCVIIDESLESTMPEILLFLVDFVII